MPWHHYETDEEIAVRLQKRAARRARKADEKARLISLGGHAPNTVHRHTDGTAYLVAASGAWIRRSEK